MDIYAIATPASYVAGGGRYGTSYDDAVIIGARALAKQFDAPVPLPSNLLVRGGATFPDLLATHQFDTYVNGAGEEMTFVMKEEMDALKSDSEPTASGCFTPPVLALTDRVQQALFALVDPAANAAESKVILAYKNAVHALVVAAALTRTVSTAIADVLGGAQKVLANPEINPTVPENYEKNFQIVKSLYGSSLDKQDYEDLNGSQGGAIAPVLLLKEKIDTPTPAQEATTTSATTSEPLRLSYILDMDPGGTAYPQAPAQNASDISASTTAGDSDDASSTSSQELPADDDNAEASTPPRPNPEPHGSPVVDTFDSFNTAGWQATDGNVKNFDADDGTDGSCFRGGCIIGIASLDFINIIPRTFLKGPTGYPEGALSVYIRANAVSAAPSIALSVCNAISTTCPDGNSLNVIGFTVNDGVWHHYYYAWRPGVSTIQTCFMQDEMRPSYCTWNEDTGIPNGAQFDGVALWSQNSYRNDLGTNIWFDELEAQ